jgi:hypothetical protein
MDRILNEEKSTRSMEKDGVEIAPTDLAASEYKKVELVWPGKENVTWVSQSSNGQWKLAVGWPEPVNSPG